MLNNLSNFSWYICHSGVFKQRCHLTALSHVAGLLILTVRLLMLDNLSNFSWYICHSGVFKQRCRLTTLSHVAGLLILSVGYCEIVNVE